MINPETLKATTILRSLYTSKIPVSEETVRMGLDRLLTWDEDKVPDKAAVILMGACARTGGIFVLDPEDVLAVAKAYEVDPAEPEPLPPLPFPRMFVEFVDKDRDLANILFDTFLPKSGDDSSYEHFLGTRTVEAFGIAQHGDAWAVGTWDTDPDTGGADPQFHYRVIREASVNHGAGLVAGAIAAIDLVGPRLATQSYPRQTRRQYERRFRFSVPRIYEVSLAGEGDHPTGSGLREYHCRWVVRGHWRKSGEGRTWVRPYVKGPAGAPWRGRPVYTGTPT